jgi:hypothetical protein
VFSKQDGVRHLDVSNFREALTELNLKWALNSDAVKSLFKAIENAHGSIFGLTLEMIGCCIFTNSKVDLLREEASVMEQV